MSSINPKTICLFDRVRFQSGSEGLKKLFNKLAHQNINTVINLLNSRSLTFCSLFTLKGEIEKFELLPRINSRNAFTLRLISALTIDRNMDIVRFLGKYPKSHLALKWIIETGWIDDGLSHQYDEVLDTAASLLVKAFKDKTILPLLIQIIYNRYHKGLLIYDMVWILFESRSPIILSLIAKRLCSNRESDAQLSYRLLQFLPCVARYKNEDGFTQFISFISWYRDNNVFLYYTGESSHQSCNPNPYTVNLEAKYLCKAVSPDDGRIKGIIPRAIHTTLVRFKELDHSTQLSLANYSFMLYRKSLKEWNKWIVHPLEQQIWIAKSFQGGSL